MNIGMCWRCLIIWSAKFRPIIEVKLPTVWTDEKAEVGRVREEKRREEKRRADKKQEDQRRERLRRKTTLFFQWCVAPEGRKVGSLKRRVRSHLARWEMKNCMPLWHKAHYEVKVYKIRQLRSTFRNWDVEKVHAVVARITFRSQNC